MPLINATSVSVIIAARNAELFIVDALESVAKQTVPPLEVIVVDDHSSDGTRDIVASHYPSTRLLDSAGFGVAAARNTAILAAKGRYIANLDADDVWLENKLEEQLSRLTEKAIVFSQAQNWKNIDGAQKEIGAAFPLEAPLNVINYILYSTSIPGSSWMIARQTFLEVGLFDESLLVGEDGEFFTRALLNRCRFILVKKVLVLRRLHDHNLHVAVYMSGFKAKWNIVESFDKYTAKQLAYKSGLTHGGILSALILIKFILKGLNDARYNTSRNPWSPYELLLTCLWFSLKTPRVWRGVAAGLMLFVTDSDARTRFKFILSQWKLELVYFSNIGNAAKKSSI